MFAAIRIRGNIGIDVNIRKTLDMLRLYNQHNCVFVKNNPKMKGMLVKVKDYITWGEVDSDTMKLISEKKGEEYKGPTEDKSKKINYSNKFIEFNGKKLKHVFRLNPPKGGFEKKGIKTSYAAGGALGYRGQDINVLLKKMI